MLEAIKRHKVRSCIIIFLFIAFLGRYEYKMPKRNFADFHVNYYTAQKLAERQNIYDDNAYRKDKVANFKYPPIVALLFYPLGFLPQNAAAISWYALNFILILIFFWCFSFLLFDKEFAEKEKNWVYFLTALFTLRFFMCNFDEGQVNILMMSTLAVGLYFLSCKKQALSGLFVSFSCLVKYMSAIFLPYFLYKRKMKAFFYVLFYTAIFSLMPALFLGWDYNIFLQKSFLPFLFKTSLDFGSIANHQNQSLISMFTRFFSGISGFNVNILSLDKNYLIVLFVLSAAALYLAALLKASRVLKEGNFTGALNAAVLFISIPLFNPNGWIHGFIFLVLPYMGCLYYLFKIKHKDAMVWFLVAVSVILNTWPDELFIVKGVPEATQVFSFLTFGSLLLFAALCKIKFFPAAAFKAGN